MRVELKCVRLNQRLSEETNCFSADLWCDGVNVGEVTNRGMGGPNEYRARVGMVSKLQAFFVYAKTVHPEFKYEPEDVLISDLLDDAADAKRLAKLVKQCQRSTLFIKPGEQKTGVYWEIKVPITPELRAKVLAKHPGVTFINDDPQAYHAKCVAMAKQETNAILDRLAKLPEVPAEVTQQMALAHE